MYWGSEPPCAKYAEGAPKLLTYQELLVFNSTSNHKVRVKKQKGLEIDSQGDE